MTNQRPWPSELTKGVGRAIRRYRTERNMSAEQLAEAVSACGLRYTRTQVTNLESGRRDSITVGEVLAFAAVLGVAPILLLFELGERPVTEVLPSREAPTWDAAKWFTGEGPFPTLVNGKWITTPADWQAWRDGAAPVDLMRYHDRYLSDWRSATASAAGARKGAELAATDAERDAHLREAAAEDKSRELIEALLSETRHAMRRLGLDPGELTANLRHIDQISALAAAEQLMRDA